MKSSDICAALRARYAQPEWALFFEVASGTGANARRHADALAMNMYPSRGLAILGFEIKVSRGDLKRELINPDKAEEIAKFCNEWWLVVPEGLIKEDDLIPATWGVMECNDDKISVSKKASWMEGQPVTKQFMAAVVRSAGRIDAQTIGEAEARAYSKYSKNLGDEIRHGVEAETKRYRAMMENVKEFERITGKTIDRYTDVEGLAERIKIAEKMDVLHSRVGGLKFIRKMMEDFLEKTKNLDELNKHVAG